MHSMCYSGKSVFGVGVGIKCLISKCVVFFNGGKNLYVRF